jgi:hypothetical protein
MMAKDHRAALRGFPLGEDREDFYLLETADAT